eukprot:NODE_120_length_18891_cov_0.302682.p10 type:complete len:122 gc:universal NODE_120_length_18891_cov_0.302682:17007-17372(+)
MGRPPRETLGYTLSIEEPDQLRHVVKTVFKNTGNAKQRAYSKFCKTLYAIENTIELYDKFEHNVKTLDKLIEDVKNHIKLRELQKTELVKHAKCLLAELKNSDEKPSSINMDEAIIVEMFD